jgi:hypothetical protein
MRPASRAGLLRVALFTAAYLLIATVGAFASGNSEFVFYIVVMVILAALVGVVHFQISLWLIPDRLKYDQVVHAYGFGVTTWICWLGLQATLSGAGKDAIPTAGRLVLVWAAGQGFGALNEVIEFAATLLVPETNVGGYLNTGWDLVSNLVGATLAVVLIWFSHERNRSELDTGGNDG